MGKKHFCFFETAETGNRTPNSGVKGSGANHYPRAPALWVKVAPHSLNIYLFTSVTGRNDFLWKLNARAGDEPVRAVVADGSINQYTRPQVFWLKIVCSS